MTDHSVVTTHVLAASPLRKPRVGKLILLGLATLVLVGLLGLASLVAGVQTDVLQVLAVALLLAAIASLPALALLWYQDRREREAPWLFLSVFLWGAVVATGLSMLLNRLGGEIVTSALNEYFLAQTVAQERADTVTSLDEQIKAEQRFGLRKIPGYPAKTSRAIVNAQNELAFRKKWLSQTGQEIATDDVVQAWRDRIAHLRAD
jgi:hypothetical protein